MKKLLLAVFAFSLACNAGAGYDEDGAIFLEDSPFLFTIQIL